MKYDETKFNACLALKELYLRNYSYSIANNPKDSLLNALCLWNTNTALLLEDKQKIILKFLDDEPIIMSLLTLDLLEKNNYSHSVSLEEFKTDVCDNSAVTYAGLFSVVNIVIHKIADIIIKTKSIKLLCEFNIIFATLSDPLKLKLLPSIYRVDIFALLDSADKEQAYWGSKYMHRYDSVSYQKLLQYNPMSLVRYYASTDIIRDNVDDILCALRRLIELNIDVRRDQNGSYYLKKLFNKLDELSYSDDIAQLEFDFYKRKQIAGFLEGMERYYFYNPNQIIEALNNEATKHAMYFDIAYSFELPAIAYDDFVKFEFFFDSLTSTCTDKDYAYGIAGQILGRSIVGSDSIFPHEFARQIIEKYKSEKLNRDFIIGRSNKTGMQMRAVGDGSDQMDIASKLKDDANRICLQYPVTAQLLHKLSEEHVREASMDRVWSEIDFD